MTLVGRHIGRYRILEELGSGGMSVVYKGLDTALDREVAVKVLHPHLAGKDESRKRLAREARAVAKLHHPNILEVFDFSPAEAHDAFIVTEYIRGRTLKTYLDEGALEPPELAAMIIHELAAALAHAHESGVIHRDLKPDNVMVREDGVLKLMDFGIARLLDIEERMTVTGTLVGSPAHMSPEIIEGLEAGPEADVFSLGIMFYALLTGRLPFSAPNTTATLKRILDGAYEDPRRRVPSLSDELAEICALCLQRDPRRRYADAGQLRDALADYLTGLGFPRVGEELVSFFADPPSYKKLARQRIVAALLERGERLLAEKRTPRALAHLNQVLALDADNARALALLKNVQRAQRLRTWRRRGLRLGTAAVVAGVLGTVGWKVHALREPAAPVPTPPSATAPTPQPIARVTPPPTRATPPAPPVTTVVRTAMERPPAPHPAPPESTEEPRSAARKGTAPVRTMPVSILVRPYGFVRVDDAPASAQPLAQHNVQTTPGRHSVTITCDYCEDTTETIDVSAEGDNVFRLRALLKPSQLSFDYQPADALVQVGDTRRTAHDSLAQPFEIRSPRGPASFQHRVEVEISRPGFRAEKRVVLLEPGKPTTLRGTLHPE
ncbi:protein kinase [Corallococcus sp. M34]|uniref:serine/threonine-protein kinase n=1 Tax=Citreicoccus inhibens TaxID=2849499 RepID=UPI001C221208|nr:serine/threonine-protein kinase [Citreicoccus inhibens]MBU8894559.1 protein kinase [Citreicoccus inhibens]